MAILGTSTQTYLIKCLIGFAYKLEQKSSGLINLLTDEEGNRDVILQKNPENTMEPVSNGEVFKKNGKKTDIYT